MGDLKSSYFYYPFAATLAGFILPLVTGLLSASSSGLIIYIICRSQQKFSTTYHRIMALMSVFDIISSLFIALGTIMVPSDTIYKFAGPLLGTKTTCQIQGGLIMFGLTATTTLNVCLSWYFAFRFAFRISVYKMTKWIEPMMYLVTLIMALLVPSVYLTKDLIHPNAYDCFCVMVPYPESCTEDKWYDWSYCDWKDGDIDKYYTFARIMYTGIVVYFVMIVIGMSIILWAVNKNRREIISFTSNDPSSHQHHQYEQREIPSTVIMELSSEDNHAKKEQIINDLQHSRVLILQALMYIGAFFLTWIFNVLSGGLNITNRTMDAINSVLFPLQGFWNLLIFLYDKSYAIQRERDDRISFWQSI